MNNFFKNLFLQKKTFFNQKIDFNKKLAFNKNLAFHKNLVFHKNLAFNNNLDFSGFTDFTGFIFNIFHKSKIINLEKIPSLSSSNNKIKNLFLDVDLFLDKKYGLFSFIKNYEPTLFHLAGEYRLIALSDKLIQDSAYYKYLDPVNCFSYKIFSRDFKNIKFNKNNCVILTPSPEKFNIDVLKTNSSDLFTIVSFLHEKKSEFKEIVDNYNGRDCIESYKVERSLKYLFPQTKKEEEFYKESYESCKDYFAKNIKDNYDIKKISVGIIKTILF